MHRHAIVSRRLLGWTVGCALICGAAECDVGPIQDFLSANIEPHERIIARGGTAVFNITVSSRMNINAAVALAVGGVPADWTALFSPPTIPDTGISATLTVHVPADTELGTRRLQVTLTEVGGESESETLLVHVVEDPGQPDFSIELDPAEYTFQGGESPTLTYRIHSVNGFVGTVNVSLADIVPPIVLAGDPSPATIELDGSAGGTYVLRADGDDPFEFDFRLIATSGNRTHERTVRVRRQEAAPVTGACCMDGVCSTVTSAQCQTTGGAYQGDGVNCSSGLCDSSGIGACCLLGDCFMATAVECQGQEGTFRGVGSSCLACAE